MEKKYNEASVTVAIEEWSIPTYPIPSEEEMPMFAETSNHQGTTGDPYPARVVSEADSEHRADKKWTVIRLENRFIRLAIIPALGGRIFEAYDKVTGYDFLYRQHVIKPALIGAYGSWISGGIEFNWPFHHRPSTVMPVDYTVEKNEDGSVTVWLSEHAPNDRTKGTVGVVLRPDTSYFETRVRITNRTPVKHNFLWWENAAVKVHPKYRLVFPPDVKWVHHHNDAGHTTFPIAEGQYGSETISEPKDISWHGSSRVATSYFAAPSKYDFFGGFDYERSCGILHIADHHISPGKKMFTWGYGKNADAWESKLTDDDGAYAELMAGSYTDDQPDFTWLYPYETKSFSQFWYPTQGIGYTTYATLDAAVALLREESELRLNVTAVREGMTLTVSDGEGRALLMKNVSATPSKAVIIPFEYPEGVRLTVALTADDGSELLNYTEETPDTVHIPADNKGIPLPSEIKTAMELVIAGQHLDQYRSPFYKPDLYYLEALRREPDFLPALKGLGEFYTRTMCFEKALVYLDKAWSVECIYNQNPEDGTVGYHRGLCLMALDRADEAYDSLYRSAWSCNVISPAMTAIAAIDGTRGDHSAMLKHARTALEHDGCHPIATAYEALALWKRGNTREGAQVCRKALSGDPLNQLVRYALTVITGKGRRAFYESLSSNPAQTALDIAFDLLDGGFINETVMLIKGVIPYSKHSGMLRYTLAYCLELNGDTAGAKRQRALASKDLIVDVFPMRAGEMRVLSAAIKANESDGFASYLLGCIKYNARLYEEAAELWRASIRYLPDFYIPYRNLALAYFNHLDRGEEALPLLRRAVELHPKDGTLLTELATVMEMLGGSFSENAAFLDSNKPDRPNDQIQLTVARAYNAAEQFDKAEEVMRSHRFSPGEGAEYATAEPYMYACFARGRIAMKEGRYADALADFRAAQELPENLNVGFWNESVTMPYRYYEAAALTALGKNDEAEIIIRMLSEMKNEGMWGMGGEFVYYSAMAVRLGGEELRAQKIMRDAILAWEKELDGGCRYHCEIGSIYNCFVGNGTKNRLGALYGMLGYGKLYNGDNEGARECFKRSLSFVPSPKIAFELSLMD